MEEVKIICTPFLIAATVFTFAMLYYELNWRRKNPWWQQDDSKMRLSPKELCYRQNERRRHHNTLMYCFAFLFLDLGLMTMALLKGLNGSLTDIGYRWFYLLPFIGAILLIASGLERKK